MGSGAPRDEWDLTLEAAKIPVAGRRGRGITINGQYPGPLVRLREGHEAVIRVHNQLRGPASVHWHGLLLPPEMDGVPGVSFDGIEAGTTFEYRFRVRQSGTYWYHSHVGTQEQRGLLGAMVIDPAVDGSGDTAGPIDREFIVVFSDWTFMDAARIMAVLKKQSHYFNFQKRTVFDALSGRDGMTLRQTLMWGRMRMNPTDISDVTAAAYEFLINGHDAAENWTAVFRPGERIRLRFINASAMTTFDVRIPGLPLQIVGADGQPVVPVEVDEFRIAVAETYDVVVTPEAQAYTLFAETMDRSGFARGTLAPRDGMAAPIPERRKRPLLTMADMGMVHDTAGGMSEMAGTDHDAAGSAHHQGHGAQAPPDPSAALYVRRSEAKGIPPADLGALGPIPRHGPDGHGPGNIMVAEQPRLRVAERGIGLEDAPWRVLVYADLMAPVDGVDPRPPAREIEVHLTGHMELYIWSFDGKKYAEDPFVDLS
ncbi:MAG: copper resistance system multicopper oxidase [Myxococcota bacterium]